MEVWEEATTLLFVAISSTIVGMSLMIVVYLRLILNQQYQKVLMCYFIEENKIDMHIWSSKRYYF